MAFPDPGDKLQGKSFFYLILRLCRPGVIVFMAGQLLFLFFFKSWGTD